MSIFETILSEYLTPKEAAAELKVTSKTIYRWRVLREGPPVTKIGRKVLYRRSAIAAWLRNREEA